MNIINKIFGLKRPTLKRDEITNFEAVAKFVIWFIENEPFVNVISNRSINIIYAEGYRPLSNAENNPENNPRIFKEGVVDLRTWFVTKVFLDLNILKNASKIEFKKFIDNLDEAGKETLGTAGEIGFKYKVSMINSVYEREIEKIPVGKEREDYKFNSLADDVLGAEIRILAWIYHEYFNEWWLE